MSMTSIKVLIDAPSSCIKDEAQTDQESKSTKPSAGGTETSILVRIHAGYFTISLSLCSQALLWKTLSTHTHTLDETSIEHNSLMGFSHYMPSTAFFLLWWLALATLILVSLLYCMRCIFHFHKVKAEFSDHVGLNYLFAPWVSWLLLVQSVPKNISKHTLWWPLVIPVITLDIKLYGQWFTTEKRFLSLVANPTSQMSVLTNMVAAWAAAEMRWQETAACLFTVGAVHYLVVFITLYQRFSGADRFPAVLRPVFFLFVAAPSAASLAWSAISGTFDTSSKMLFFLSLFLLISLASRPAIFKKSMKRYSAAWWAYSFPLTLLALASAEYAKEIKGVMAPGLMISLSAISVLVFLGLMVITALKSGSLLWENDPYLRFIGGQN